MSKIRSLTCSKDLLDNRKKYIKEQRIYFIYIYACVYIPRIIYSESKENDMKRYASGTPGMIFWSRLKKLHGRRGKT